MRRSRKLTKLAVVVVGCAFLLVVCSGLGVQLFFLLSTLHHENQLAKSRPEKNLKEFLYHRDQLVKRGTLVRLNLKILAPAKERRFHEAINSCRESEIVNHEDFFYAIGFNNEFGLMEFIVIYLRPDKEKAVLNHIKNIIPVQKVSDDEVD